VCTGFTVENGVVAGTGTSDDPYLIVGWSIDATEVPFGINVEGTTKAFTIEACRVFGASSTAINLVDVKRASVIDCQMESSFYGLVLEKAQHARISTNTFSENAYAALFLLNTTDSDICDNIFHSGGTGILFYLPDRDLYPIIRWGRKPDLPQRLPLLSRGERGLQYVGRWPRCRESLE
jgi:hypothetical protein